MAAVCTLNHNQGREYRPTSWRDSPLGGHRRRDVLEFPARDGTPEVITLVIRQTANIPARIFEWKVEQ